MTSTVPGTEERFNMRDGSRPITFEGWKLAEADSQTGSEPRWTELTLYKTLTGRYVLEKVGRSDVFHSDSCTRRSKGVRHNDLDSAAPDDDDSELEELFVPCDECHPSYDDAPVWVERDIPAVAVFESPQKLMDSLFRRNGDNTQFLSRISRALLEDAAKLDAGIREVMAAPADVT